ncbi:MAG: hypothetical protein ACK2UW_17475 [Anaerolineales bacterium]|jgi:hypothetical protein
MKILTRIYVVVLLTIFAAACSTTPEEFPTGIYIDDNGGVIEFKEDGTYQLSDSVGKEPQIFGEYVIDQDTITISDNLFYCPDYVGKYHWSVAKDRSLNFEVIEEECVRRQIILVKGLALLQP